MVRRETHAPRFCEETVNTGAVRNELNGTKRTDVASVMRRARDQRMTTRPLWRLTVIASKKERSLISTWNRQEASEGKRWAVSTTPRLTNFDPVHQMCSFTKILIRAMAPL